MIFGIDQTTLLAAAAAFALLSALAWGKATALENGSPDYITGAILGALLGPIGLVASLHRLYSAGGANIKSWFSQTAALAAILVIGAFVFLVASPSMNDDATLSSDDLAKATKSIKAHYEVEKGAKGVNVSAAKEAPGRASALVVATLNGAPIGVSCTIIKDASSKMISWSCR